MLRRNGEMYPAASGRTKAGWSLFGDIEPPFDPVDLVGEPIQPQAHLCHTSGIGSLVPSKSGKAEFDPCQTAALLAQTVSHVAKVRTDGAQMLKDKTVGIFRHGTTLT